MVVMKKKRHTVRNVVLGVLATGTALCFILGGVLLLWASTLTMPSIAIIEAQRKEQSTKIYDRTGTVLLYDMHQDVQRTVVPLTDISDNIKHATIAIEDAGFYSHFGIEPLAILRAVFKNIAAGDPLGGQGGSTITQQVVKNALLVRDKTIARKLKEWVLAIKLEREMSKDQILELYLNEIPYGGTKYGVEEASQAFFGVSAKDLTIAESAYLAALPQAPTYYSPYGPHRAALEERKNLVLQRMHDLGYITDDEYAQAKSEQVTFRPVSSGSIKAPHFVFYVIDQLSKLYGDTDLATANLKVTTTLDWDLEREAERIVYEHAQENVKTFNASNASLMAIDPNSGDIWVMVGSRDYFDDTIDGNFNIGLATRQPGSAFKPFAYAAAIARGYTSETVVYDVATQFSTACDKTNLTSDNGCYSPSNYDDKFRGPMTFRNALAQSVNIPAVKVMYLVGPKAVYDLARNMGITTLDPDYRRYGLTLVLGGGEVSLLEMTSAYGVFAHEGYRYPERSILEIDDGDGKVVYHEDPTGEQILDPKVALTISDMLDDNVARTPEFGSDSYLNFPGRDVAVKTGTTNDYRDAWIIGYTPSIAAGAWAGNNDNSPMVKKIAGFIVAPMWNEFMQKYFELKGASPAFPPPPPIDPTIKPVLRGYIYTPTAAETMDASSTQPDTRSVQGAVPPHSILQYVNKDDPRGPAPTNPANDPQYPYWEYGVLLWSLGQGSATLQDVVNQNNTTNTSHPTVTIERPNSGASTRLTEPFEVRLSIDSAQPISRIDYYVDSTLVGSVSNGSTSYSFKPSDHDITRGDHTLMVIAYDTGGGSGGSSASFTVR